MPPKRKRDVTEADGASVKKVKLDTSDQSVPASKNSNKNNSNNKKKVGPKLPLHPLNEPLPTVFDLEEGDEDEDIAVVAAQPFTADEMEIMKISQAIREKPNWLSKLFDEKIRRKWKAEALDQGAENWVINYVFAELEQHYAFCIDGAIEISLVDGVYQADNLIPEDVKSAFVEQVAVLENVPDDAKDWHPDSKNQVLDLVHPSLYCYVSGVTKVTRKQLPWAQLMGAGSISAIPKEPNMHPGKSATYQWLPAEFNVDPEGAVTIASYINNLHPHVHAALYQSLAAIFEQFVPLFNRVLTDVVHPRGQRLTANDYQQGHDDTFELRDVPVFRGLPPPPSVVNLNGRELQVIVKLANIVLTPDSPHYKGGVWHVEGMCNERIVATGIYYYGSENISESKLEFRQAVSMPEIGWLHNDADIQRMTEEVFRITSGTPGNQKLGSVVTKEDRCIAFPNLYQHKVAPFKLIDGTKPGVRRILVFFLVDPVTPVLSTAHVPPQQSEWIKMEISKREGTRLEDLPNELMQEILSNVDFGMTLEQAKQHRLELMKERKHYVARSSTKIFERPIEWDEEDEDEDEDDYNLCEH